MSYTPTGSVTERTCNQRTRPAIVHMAVLYPATLTDAPCPALNGIRGRGDDRRVPLYP